MKRRLQRTALFLLCSLCGLEAYAQNSGNTNNDEKLPTVIPPSPNAAAMAKYGNIPVSAYTGVPNISIPLYEIAVRDIKVPISIEYHASGIKVSEEASRVGLGWSLNAGGAISRSIMNLDDFWQQPYAFFFPGNNKDIQLPHEPRAIYSDFTSHRDLYVQFGNKLRYLDSATHTMKTIDLGDIFDNSEVDFEPDQFTFNFPGAAGKFVLDNVLRKPVLEKQEKLLIQPSANGQSWVIKTANGFAYTFADVETYRDPNGGHTPISSWYLTEIESPQGEHVTFHYDQDFNREVKTAGAFSEVRESLKKVLGPTVFNCQSVAQGGAPTKAPVQKYSHIILSSITWSHGSVEFKYEDRLDIDGDKRLASVIVKDKVGIPFLNFSFGYDYFVSNLVGNEFGTDVSTNQLTKRLKLVSLTKSAAVPQFVQPETHSFRYYEGNAYQLPAKSSFARDHWGYFNGKQSNTSLIPSYTNLANPITPEEMMGVMGSERDASKEHVKAFSLREITFPTGGSSSFEYESNTYDALTDDIYQHLPEAWLDKKTLFYPGTNKGEEYDGNVDPGKLDLTDEYQSSQGSYVPVDVDVKFRLTRSCEEVSSQINAYFRMVEDATGFERIVRMSSCTCQRANPEDASSAFAPIFSYRTKYVLPKGKYSWYAFVQADDGFIQDITANFSYWVDSKKRAPSSTETQKFFTVGGGLRIARIEDYDPESSRKYNVRTYRYHDIEDRNGDGVLEEYSNGHRMAQPSYSYYTISTQADATSELVCNCLHLLRSSESGVQMTNGMGIAVGYDRVVETFGENGELGYTLYEYQNEKPVIRRYVDSENFDFEYPIRPPAFSTVADPSNGMLRRQTHYNSNGEIVKEISNDYEKKFWSIRYGMEVMKRTAMGIELNEANNVRLMLYPALQSSFITRKKSIERDFVNGQPAQKRIILTEYENPKHLQLTKTTTIESDGRTMISTFKYPHDYESDESGATLAAMKTYDFFMPGSVIEKTAYLLDGGKTYVRHRDITWFAKDGSFIHPTQKIVYDQSAPVPEDQVTGFKPADYGGVNFPPSYRLVYTLNYDASGNINALQKTRDVTVAYLWGYDQKLPIAEIKNGQASKSFYESFEEVGGIAWQDPYGNNMAKSGISVSASSTFTFPSTFAPTAPEILMSYWYFDSNDNKWHFSGEIPFAATITAPAGSHIDEIRVFEKGAQMTTYNYLLLKGMSSQTDANNLSTFYEYDAMGRLIIIRDDDHKILKTYEYGYKKQ